jgi:hypothetical protein
MNTEYINALITQYQTICQPYLGPIHDYPSLRKHTLAKELLSELDLIRGLLKEPDDFKAAFQERLRTRAKSASFEALPQSPSNQLCWDIALAVFEPKTLGEMLTYLSPNTERVVVADIDEGAIALDAKDITELTHKLKELQDNLPHTLQEKKFEPKDFPEPLEKERLAELILVDDCLFDVASISQFPLKTSSDLLKDIETKYPKLLLKLLNHNEAMQGLKTDVEVFRNNNFTPKEALMTLYRGLRLGGTKFTAQTFASAGGHSAVEQFFEYFLALPDALQTEIKALKVNTKSMANVFDTGFDKGHCVESTATDIMQIVQANSGNKALNNPPHLSANARQSLIQKYRKKRPCAQNQEFISPQDLPSQHLMEALKEIRFNTAEDIITLFIEFPPELYATLLEGLNLLWNQNNRSTFVSNGALSLFAAANDGFFNPAQKEALAKAMGKQQQRFPMVEFCHSLTWSVDWSFITAILTAMDEGELRSTLRQPDKLGSLLIHKAAKNPEALAFILNQYPKKQWVELIATKTVEFSSAGGRTVLHEAAANPKSVQTLLDLVKQNLNLLKIQDKRRRTVLHEAVYSPESIQLLLNLIPQNKRLAALKVTDDEGNNLLHLAASNTESLKAILTLLTEEQRLAALKDERAGENLLNSVAKHPESLKMLFSLVPLKQQQDLLRLKDTRKLTPFHSAATTPESIKFLLSLVPKEKRLDRLKQRSWFQTVFHFAASSPESLQAIVNLLPEKKRADVLKIQGVMQRACVNNPESLKLLLSLIPEKQRWDVLKEGSALRIAALNPESIKTLLSLIPEKKRAELPKLKGLLHMAAQKPESLKLLLDLIPLNQRHNALKTKYCGRSLISWAADDPNSLNLVLSLYPQDELQDALNLKMNWRETVRDLLVRRPESLNAFLSLVPESQRLNLLKAKDRLGHSALHQMADIGSLETVLSLIPESQHLQALKLRDAHGYTVLERHVQIHNIRSYLYFSRGSYESEDPIWQRVPKAYEDLVNHSPSARLLLVAIDKLKEYGESLSRRSKNNQGKEAIDLANRLDELANAYLRAEEDTEEKIQQKEKLRAQFRQALESGHKKLGQHQEAWKPILANIAIAATGIGLLVLAVKIALSKTGFFSTTKRQHLSQGIKEAFKKEVIVNEIQAVNKP